MAENIQAPTRAAADLNVIGYINERVARILAQGTTVCTHISPVKTEYAQVPLCAEVSK